MKICTQCGALYLASEASYECIACSNVGEYDDSGDGMHSVPLRDLTAAERVELYHWLVRYRWGDP